MGASRDRIRVPRLRQLVTTLRGERKFGFVNFSRFDASVCKRPASGPPALEPAPPTQEPTANENREPQVDDPRPRGWISPSKWRCGKHCLHLSRIVREKKIVWCAHTMTP